MLFNWICFPKFGKDKCFKKLVGKKFTFTIPNGLYKTASIVVLLGENGTGKSTLLNCLEIVFDTLNNDIKRIINMEKTSYPSYFDNDNTKNKINDYCNYHNFLYANFYIDRERYCCFRYNLLEKNNKIQSNSSEFLSIDYYYYNGSAIPSNYRWQRVPTPVIFPNSPIFFSSSPITHSSPHHDSSNAWNEKNMDYDKTISLFFKDSEDYFAKLETIKSEIEEKYFKNYLEMMEKVSDVNKQIANETERVNINFVKTDFKLLIDELYRITNLNISVDEKNKKFIISENNDIKYDLNELSSGQKKLLVIWFKIVEIRLFRKDKCATLLLFIDEIDNSFSPKWQEKFTYLLIKLSQDLSNEKITHQFFISTHSPFILKNFLRKERNSDTVIINVENGKNIREDKKLLLNDNGDISYDAISYDEISYLYYDVVTSNYYISLYEELKSKIDVESYKEVDNWLIMNKNKINEIIKEKELDKMTLKIKKIKYIKHYKLNNDGEIIEEKQFEQSKKQLIVFYLGELGDENSYTNWDSFVAKFNDERWRNNEKNKASIGELTKLFKCQTEEIFQKINGLDEEIKDQTKKLLQDKHDSTKMIKELENDKNKKEKDIEQLNTQIVQLKVPFKLLQLCDENSYTNWNSFVAKFKDENWKKEEKNMKIIGELCAIWKCQSNEIYDKINGLDEEIKDQAKKLFENKQHDNFWTTSTNLTRLRHMFAHAWTREKNFLFYKKHQEQFKNNNNDEEIAETNKFYSIFKKENATNEEIESLLKKYIELMRLVLINYCKITKLKPK